MGSKYKPIKNSNPGPGEYEHDDTKIRTSPSRVHMGSGARPDNFVNKQQSQVPDAGCYNHNHKGIGTDSKSAGMGSKYKPITNSNPGPGEYN